MIFTSRIAPLTYLLEAGMDEEQKKQDGKIEEHP
jgi:hypothetical protein